ncbi:MAG: hypothetical protein P8Y18_02260 [Candidatus Bathyarchaeota archaeon]
MAKTFMIELPFSFIDHIYVNRPSNVKIFEYCAAGKIDTFVLFPPNFAFAMRALVKIFHPQN